VIPSNQQRRFDGPGTKPPEATETFTQTLKEAGQGESASHRDVAKHK